MLRVVVVVAVLVVFVYGLVDVIRTDPRQTKGISKPAWIVVQIVLPVIGAILWFLIGRPRGTSPARTNYSHPIAPDDDPDFLRNLELRRRRQAEADRLKKLKDEMDAKERNTANDKGTPGTHDSESGDARGSGDAQGTDEVK
ncbi:PLD nuclease N-terminal domain-containing protein [Arthrobacter sp. AL12]|uniref:PLD nuclease N-terminal domain-containing protein n=1 Tax=Arthrobacter sp. AL12 TaxID=3042241 RepID=UPI00249B5E79|nr:PLD nuclease N-terminal domain-containing protein [Arthrobacter sp. AL12]MDI3213001.1 PLD nuclease N-terminal domain-containing protein [Arthrobacter sp. AL12]